MSILKKYSISNFFIGIVAIVFSFIIIIFFTQGLSSNNTSKEKIITYADNISPAHAEIINQFNQLYKGKIKVVPIDLPFSKFSTNERKELLARSLRSKSKKLDLFGIDIIWSARFATWSENLEKYISLDELNEILPIALNSCYYNQKLVALPIYLDIGMMFYRKDLIRKLPNGAKIEQKLKESLTWEEFLDLSKKFNLKKNPFYIFPADNYEGLVCSFIELLYNQEDTFFRGKNFNWQSDKVKKSFQLLHDLIYKYNITPPAVTDYNENMCYDYFIENNGVFLRGWPSFTKNYKFLLQSKDLENLIGKAALPHFKGSRPMSVFGGWNIMISKYSENKKEAFEFVKFILKEESQKVLYEYGAYLPILSKIYENKAFMENHKDLYYDKKLLDNGVFRPFLDDYTEISDILSYYTNQVLKGKLTIDNALINMDKSLKSGELIVR